MLKLMFIGGAIAWALWWVAPAYTPPSMVADTGFEFSTRKGMQRVETKSDVLQTQYRKNTKTMLTRNNWLSKVRAQKHHWKYYAVGFGPLALALLSLLRGIASRRV